MRLAVPSPAPPPPSSYFAGVRVFADEARYLSQAASLAGLKVNTCQECLLLSGPGYPLVLAPFLWLNMPWLAPRLLNGIFLLVAVVFLYRTLRIYLDERSAFLLSALYGVYPPLLKEAPLLMTESLAMLLMSGLLYCVCQAHTQPSGTRHHIGYLVAAGVILGYLALTRIFFGYVSVAWLGVLLARRIVTRSGMSVLVVPIVALLVCAPYLTYTYLKTGRIFYWGASGGGLLYWIATPYEGETGEWHPMDLRRLPTLEAAHGAFFDSLKDLSAVERDRALTRKGIANISQHPLKFLRNWAANLGRLIFSYPFSFRLQTPLTFVILLPNMFLFVLCILCLYPSLISPRGRKLLPTEVKLLLSLALITFLGASILSANERHFRPIVPILWTWIVLTATRVLEVRFREPFGAKRSPH
jgi:hypothetical protein